MSSSSSSPLTAVPSSWTIARNCSKASVDVLDGGRSSTHRVALGDELLLRFERRCGQGHTAVALSVERWQALELAARRLVASRRLLANRKRVHFGITAIVSASIKCEWRSNAREAKGEAQVVAQKERKPSNHRLPSVMDRRHRRSCAERGQPISALMQQSALTTVALAREVLDRGFRRRVELVEHLQTGDGQSLVYQEADAHRLFRVLEIERRERLSDESRILHVLLWHWIVNDRVTRAHAEQTHL